MFFTYHYDIIFQRHTTWKNNNIFIFVGKQVYLQYFTYHENYH